MEDNEKEHESIIDKILDCMERTFNKFFEKMPSGKKEELDTFMSNDKNLYNEDGSLTEEYKRKIKEMENYCKENSIDKILYDECKDDKDRTAIKSIIEFSNMRKDLMTKYEEAEKKDGINFNPIYWAKQQLKESASNEDYEEKMENLHYVLEEEIIDILDDDEELLNHIKDMMKKGEQNE